MSLFALMSKEDQERELAMAASTAEHLQRFTLCRQKLDSFSRAEVSAWLARLPEGERQKCRTVLNNLIAARKEKTEMQRGRKKG